MDRFPAESSISSAGELRSFVGGCFSVSDGLTAPTGNASTEASRNLSEKEALLGSHQREIQKVRDEMTRTHRLYLDGQITAQGFGQFYKPAEERLNQLTAGLPKLQS